MIKNVVFDFGQVLIRFEPAYIVARHTTDAQTARLLEDVVFDRAYWNRLDAGEITDDEAASLLRERLPTYLRELGEGVFRSWIDHLPPIEPMQKLAADLKKQNVPLFLLSNISVRFAERADEFPILKLFDKCIFSGTCRMIKPDSAIYHHMLAECGIKAEETIFIDDSAANIEAAIACGIHGYHYTGDTNALRAHLAKALNLPELL